jgi:transaldolase/glucose-6-phosphate isomerase
MMPAMLVNPQSFSLPFHLTSKVEASVNSWTAETKVQRLWDKDASLWTGSTEGLWLGWLDVVGEQLKTVERFRRITQDTFNGRFTHALLLGMGGSSLCPAVLQSTFGTLESHPELRVLDSTHPSQVRSHEQSVDLRRTLLIVSSKSGSTLESSILFEYFFSRMSGLMSPEDAASRCILITDPGSPLERLGRQRGLDQVFPGRPDIGGRFSALSNFGLVPAAVMGLDVGKLLSRTQAMVDACRSDMVPDRNPGVLLGIIMGSLTSSGRDKMTIVARPGLQGLGAWLEQLVAESTGKQGQGIVPVDGETPGLLDVYGTDRFFVYLTYESGDRWEGDSHIERLQEAGHPVVRIQLSDAYDIGQEFFRWEMATAVAGSLLGVNPFDQPDVEASKLAARRVTSEFEKVGAVPTSRPFFEESGVQLFAPSAVLAHLENCADRRSLAAYLGAYLALLNRGNYFAIHAYLEMNPSHRAFLERIRSLVRNRKRVATCLGFGPRFLHSTGQLHKGGPSTGLFLQITDEVAEDIAIPGRPYSFGTVIAAQAAGDFEVLEARRRHILRIHLGVDTAGGLRRLHEAILGGVV